MDLARFWMKGNGNEQRKTGHIPYPALLLVTVIIAVLMVDFVETMVVPGIPVIQEDLGISENTASWITSIVLIVGAAAAPLFGKLGDIHGKKKMFMIAMGFYVAGVGMAGITNSFYVLLLARGVQGIGFAVLPLSMALVTEVLPVEKIGVAQGIVSAMVSVGTALGLVIGAFMVQDLGWHYAFYAAFGISVAIWVLAWKVLKKDVPGARSKMDYSGTVMLSAGIILILLFMTEGPALGWTSLPNLTILFFGLLLTVYFFIHESKISYPMIEIKMLRIRNIMIANLTGVVSGIVIFLADFAIIYYAQLPIPDGLGLDVISTGLMLVPSTIVMVFMAPLIGRLVTSKGPRPVMICGSIVTIIGFALFIVNRGSALGVTIDTSITFAGSMAVVIPMTNMISLSLPMEEVSVGLGFNSMLRNMGGAMGPIIATTMLLSLTIPTKVFLAAYNGVPAQVKQTASTIAFNDIFIIGIVLGAILLLLSLLVKNYTFNKERPAKSKERLPWRK
jgi:MFS family permease